MAPDAAVAQAIALHADRPGGLLPLLHEIQDRLGYVPPQCVPTVAKAMRLSIAEVHGVVGFYHHFRRSPPGRHVLRICLAEACQSMGSRELLDHARKMTGTDLHGTSADGAVTLEPVYCLGNCACSPAVMLDQQLVGRVDAQRLAGIIEHCRVRA
ncbi:MAG TPA: formate dehydrogenase subunit gamma [Burkholderiaceae bacterium]|nr:formate dehydrogenase subunit gamma [Burkholderiaceae bacterium]